mgnify:CR=1 FL=1
MIQVLLLTIVLLAIAILGLGVNVFIRKRKFPNTHIGGNKEMMKRGIYCAKTFDKIEHKKAIEEIRIKNLKHLKLADV